MGFFNESIGYTTKSNITVGVGTDIYPWQNTKSFAVEKFNHK
jgi:hypothetical protein